MNPTHPRLLAAIRDACPEIMELTFGCKYLVGNEVHVLINVKEDRYTGGIVAGDGTVWGLQGIDHAFDLEILGHEIQLSHVLRTLHTLPAENRPMYFNVGCDGGFYEVRYEDEDGRCVIRHNGLGGVGVGWDFLVPLSGQSPATLDWLEKVICGT